MRRNILFRLQSVVRDSFDFPLIEFNDNDEISNIEKFKQMTKAVGGDIEMIDEGKTIDDIIKDRYPNVKRISSNLQYIPCVNDNPDQYEDPRDLYGVDVAIVRGEFGVAENGAVWIKQNVRHRALYFVTEILVVVIKRETIIGSMHDAYKRPDFNDYHYGSFISGPSKTADIEQALVLGAQAAKAFLVILE